MTLDAPAFYLECRYDRVQSLRQLSVRLHQALLDTPEDDQAQLTRLRRRLARVHRHLDTLTGAAL